MVMDFWGEKGLLLGWATPGSRKVIGLSKPGGPNEATASRSFPPSSFDGFLLLSWPILALRRIERGRLGGGDAPSPQGFASCYETLPPTSVVFYKVTNF